MPIHTHISTTATDINTVKQISSGVIYFLSKHTKHSTWVKTPKGLKTCQKRGWKEQKVSLLTKFFYLFK